MKKIDEYIIVEGNAKSLENDVYYHCVLEDGRYDFVLSLWDNYDYEETKEPVESIINIDDDHWNGIQWKFSAVNVERGFLSSKLNINWYNNAFDGVIKSNSQIGRYAKWKLACTRFDESETYILPKPLASGTGEIDKQFPYLEYIPPGQYAFIIKVINNKNDDGTANQAHFYVNDNHWWFGRWKVGSGNIYHGYELSKLNIIDKEGKDNTHFESQITPLRLAHNAQWVFSYILVENIPSSEELPAPPLPKRPETKPGEYTIAEGNRDDIKHDIPYHFQLIYGRFAFKFEVWDNSDDVLRTNPAYAKFKIEDEHFISEWSISEEPIFSGELIKYTDVTWYNDSFDGIIKSAIKLGKYAQWRFSYEHIDSIPGFRIPVTLTEGTGEDIGIRFPYRKVIKPGKYGFILKVFNNINDDKRPNLAWFYTNDWHWWTGRWHVGGTFTSIFHGIKKEDLEITDKNGKFNAYIAPLRLAHNAQWVFAYVPINDDGTPQNPPPGTPPTDPPGKKRPKKPPKEPDLPVPDDEPKAEPYPMPKEPEEIPNIITKKHTEKTLFGQNNEYTNVDVINAIRANLNYYKQMRLYRHGTLSLTDLAIKSTGTQSMLLVMDRGYSLINDRSDGQTYVYPNVGKYHEIAAEPSDKEYPRYDTLTLGIDDNDVLLKYYQGEINDVDKQKEEKSAKYNYYEPPVDEVVLGYVLIPPRVQGINEEDILLSTKQIDIYSGYHNSFERTLPPRPLTYDKVLTPIESTEPPSEWLQLYDLIADKSLWNEQEGESWATPYYKRVIRWSVPDLTKWEYKFSSDNALIQFICYNPSKKFQSGVKLSMRLWIADDLDHETELYSGERTRGIDGNESALFGIKVNIPVSSQVKKVDWTIKYVYLEVDVFPSWMHILHGVEENKTFTIHLSKHDIDL